MTFDQFGILQRSSLKQVKERCSMFICRGILISALAAFGLAMQAQAAEFGADRHVKKGVPCEACHGAKKEIAYPTIDQCKVCHQLDALSTKTKDTKPSNPHVSPHYGKTLDCTLCHVQHAETVNYCNQCHSFNFKVP